MLTGINVRKEGGMIRTVIRLANDMVVVFDAEGEQIPEYQGKYGVVKEEILRDSPPDAVFNYWFSRDIEPEIIPPNSW